MTIVWRWRCDVRNNYHTTAWNSNFAGFTVPCTWRTHSHAACCMSVWFLMLWGTGLLHRISAYIHPICQMLSCKDWFRCPGVSLLWPVITWCIPPMNLIAALQWSNRFCWREELEIPKSWERTFKEHSSGEISSIERPHHFNESSAMQMKRHTIGDRLICLLWQKRTSGPLALLPMLSHLACP